MNEPDDSSATLLAEYACLDETGAVRQLAVCLPEQAEHLKTLWHQVVPRADHELADREPPQIEVMRQTRNRLLAESDVLALRQIERTGAVSESLKAYRQALRDMTEQDISSGVNWPTLPT